MSYGTIRDEIASQIAAANLPYNGNGVIVNDKTISRKQYFDSLAPIDRHTRQVEAQSVMGYLAGIQFEAVMVASWDMFISEK